MDHKNVKNVVGGGIYNSQVSELKVMDIEIAVIVGWLVLTISLVIPSFIKDLSKLWKKK
jgi:hypothetical protein